VMVLEGGLERFDRREREVIHRHHSRVEVRGTEPAVDNLCISG